MIIWVRVTEYILIAKGFSKFFEEGCQNYILLEETQYNFHNEIWKIVLQLLSFKLLDIYLWYGQVDYVRYQMSKSTLEKQKWCDPSASYDCQQDNVSC